MVAGQQYNKPREDFDKRGLHRTISQLRCFSRREQGAQIGKEVGVVQLREHPLFRLAAGDSHLRSLKVSPEILDHAHCVQALEYVEAVSKVEQIASFVALKQPDLT